MTITIDIRPEVQAELARVRPQRAAASWRPTPPALLEEALQASQAEAVHPPVTRSTGQALIDSFAEFRGLLTDEEIDRMFRRSPSTVRGVKALLTRLRRRVWSGGFETSIEPVSPSSARKR